MSCESFATGSSDTSFALDVGCGTGQPHRSVAVTRSGWHSLKVWQAYLTPVSAQLQR
jgi:hypothetical protein